jgi:hypothetical protein
MRIVFMGTPEFAVPSLDALLKGPDQVVGIVTQPDRPKGRGQVLTPSPVKLIAQRERIPLLQPTKMKDRDIIQLEARLYCGRSVRPYSASRNPVPSALWLYQCTRITVAEVPGSRTDSMGPHQWRNRNRHHDHVDG